MKSFFKKVRNIRVILTVALPALCLCSACAGQQSARYQSVDTAMGTVIRQTVYASSDAADVMKGVREVITGLEDECLSRRKETSEIYRINAGAGVGQGIVASECLTDILDKVQQVSADSGGALDITLGEVVKLWNIDEYAVQFQGTEQESGEAVFRLPEPQDIEAALDNTGYEKIRTDENTIYLPEGMSLDMGAVGKGIACDRVLRYLKEQSAVQGAVVTVGGSVLTYGQKPDGSPWQVGIVDPRDTAAYIGNLVLNGQWCVSTSGDYERYVEKDGVRYHHIIDPATGHPADAGLISVTILSRDGLLSDALSTAVFVLGAEKGGALAEKYGAYAVMVDKDGEIILSPGAEAYFCGK